MGMVSLTDKLTNNVYVNLRNIDYKSFRGDKKEVKVNDSYQIIGLLSDEIDIIFTREVILDLESGFILTVSVEFKRYAEKDVNLNELLTEEIIQNNIYDLFDPVTNYVSLIISQITSSFNRAPIVTSPKYISSK